MNSFDDDPDDLYTLCADPAVLEEETEQILSLEEELELIELEEEDDE